MPGAVAYKIGLTGYAIFAAKRRIFSGDEVSLKRPSERHGVPESLYKEAGVDVEKGDALVDWLKATDDVSQPQSKSRLKGEVVAGIGGFAALFRPDFRGLEDPLLVSGTDGVGTKVLLGIESGHLEGLGFDLVGMCVNDLYTLGARPLFFLDYYATGVLNDAQFKAVLTGIKKACSACHTALLGGETAELPGLYEKGHFDLAGFVVGMVDGKKTLGAHRVKAGDVLYGVESSGFHSNGYSLVRRWLAKTVKTAEPAAKELLAKLMTPTKLYYEIPEILLDVGVDTLHALANITGGGISGNLPRVMPAGVRCHIDPRLIRTPDWMASFIRAHDAQPLELEAVFNLGLGMIGAVAPAGAARFETSCKAAGLGVYPIGEVKPGDGASAEAEVVFGVSHRA
jgi:phosphoribosylformylglycinamidine cyclo-ligase